MLDLRIHCADAAKPFLEGSGKVKFGGSEISVFPSNQLTMSLLEGEKARRIWFGELSDPFDGIDKEIDSYRDVSGGDGIVIFIDKEANSIRLARTARGGCPIYLAVNDGVLVASWKFDYVAESLPRRKPNLEVCRRYLKRGSDRTRDQIIDGMCMLWPGEAVDFDGASLRFREVENIRVVVPGAVHDSAHVAEEFLRLIGCAMKRNLASARQPIIELSGGFDSTCVAIAASRLRQDINTYAVIHEGAIGVQQRNRRNELIGRFGFRDFEGPSYVPGPFASLQIEECQITPLDDMYRMPCVNAVDAFPTEGIDVLLTGIGGDELTRERTYSHEAWEVPGNISTSSAVAAAGRADMFMRRGIWPVHPYVDPDVVNYCRALPAGLRRGRMLNILTIARSGVSDGFLFPRYKENYGNALRREASLFDFDAALNESVVADYGISDVTHVLTKAREATLDGLPIELIVDLHFLLKLETVLRRYLN